MIRKPGRTGKVLRAVRVLALRNASLAHEPNGRGSYHRVGFGVSFRLITQKPRKRGTPSSFTVRRAGGNYSSLDNTSIDFPIQRARSLSTFVLIDKRSRNQFGEVPEFYAYESISPACASLSGSKGEE